MLTTTFHFKIKGRPFTMNMPYIGEDTDNILIVTDEFRTTNGLTYPTKQDFINDTNFILSALESTPINSREDYAFALLKCCEQHVKEFGRIIDTDLYTYIDELLIIIKHLGKFDGVEISFDIGNVLWEFYKTVAFGAFDQHLWLNVPAMPFDHNPLRPSTRLVKYTDYYL